MDKKEVINITQILSALLIATIVFHIFHNCLWFSIDKFPPYGDDVHFHIQRALWISRHCISPGRLYNFLRSDFFAYPPFFHIIGAMLHLFDSPHLPFHTIYLTSSLFFIVLILSVYKLGQELFNKELGLFAAIILSFFPVIYKYSRHFNDGIAAIAMVSLSTYCLLSTKGFTRRKFSILFGVTLGLGMLTKETFLIFIFFPWAFVTSRTLFFNKARNARKISNLLLAMTIGISIVIISNHYHYLIFDVTARKDIYFKVFYPRIQGSSEWRNVLDSKAFFYFEFIQNKLLTNFFTSLFLLSLVSLLLSKVPKLNKFFFILWLLFPIVCLTILPLKNSRYITSLLVPMAIISAYGLSNIRGDIIKLIVIICIMVFGLTQYYLISFAVFPPRLNIERKFISNILRPELREPPLSNRWIYSYGEFLSRELYRHNKRVAFFCYEEPHFHSVTYFFQELDSYIRLHRLNIELIPYWYPDTINFQNFLNELEKIDMFICISHDTDFSSSISNRSIWIQKYERIIKKGTDHYPYKVEIPEETREKIASVLLSFRLVKRDILNVLGYSEPCDNLCDGYAYIFKKP